MRHEILGYSSVMGSHHYDTGLPNQDSYLIKKYKFGTLVVVSDGMGSHAHADVGSRAVCSSVSRAIQLWWEYGVDDIRLVIPLLHSLWGMSIYPYLKNECGATCLFAFMSMNGRLHLGQLGDGSIFYDIGNETQILKDKDDDFANLTSGIGNLHSFEEWTIQTFDVKDNPVRVCLMTDGVAETLIEEKRTEFVELIWKKMSEKDNFVDRNNMIHRLLSEWTPANAGDDRTLVSYEKK